MNKLLSLLGLARKAGKLVLGFGATCAAIENDRLQLVIVAGDSAKNTQKKIERICRRYNVPLYYLLNREELSRAIGKRNQVVIGMLPHGLTGALEKRLLSVKSNNWRWFDDQNTRA